MNDWEKRYNSLKEAFDKLKKENEYLKHENKIMELQKKQWEIEKINQQLIIKSQLENGDRQISNMQNEIIALKKKYNIRE